MAIDLDELIEMRDRLFRARAKGVLTVQMGEERIQYRSDAEMVIVIADLEARIQRASTRPKANTIRFATSKGM